MNRVIPLATLAFALALLSPQSAAAQGTIYVSSLAGTPVGSLPVGNDSWLAARFATGTNAAGYLLNSVQLALTNALGNPSGFTAMLYTTVGPAGPTPGSSLGTLNGSLDPVVGGIYTYSPGSILTLSPTTSYFIVLTAGTAVADGAYEWSYTSTAPTLNGGWTAANVVLSSADGLHWSPHSGFAQFSVSATDVPEPSTLGLLALGGCLLACHRRKATPLDTTPKRGPLPSCTWGFP